VNQADSVRLRVIVTGRVQGVFYRVEAATQAKRLGIHGFARNLPDGSVELVGEGGRLALQSLLEWARNGPSRARVAHVVVEWSEFTGTFHDFSVH
jgi:acylphosphatase